jgi:hypothetical protein
MHTAIECLTKAAELDERAKQCEPGPSRDAFLEMARQWRGLAAKSRLTPPPLH